MSDTIVIRKADLRDLDAVYEICLQTGDAGRDASGLYDDPRLIGHIYAGPYVALPGLISFVAEDGMGLVGYAVGAANTAAYERRLEVDWWPVLRRRYARPSGSSGDWTQDERRIASIHRPSSVPADVVARFPAHIHMNLLPRARGRGLGSGLLEAWVDDARDKGVAAVHAGVSAVNSDGLAFWTARGFLPVKTQPDGGTSGTIWCGKVL
ncbi:GNAT family N-acetyltransferase [Roseibium sp. M-1]